MNELGFSYRPESVIAMHRPSPDLEGMKQRFTKIDFGDGTPPSLKFGSPEYIGGYDGQIVQVEFHFFSITSIGTKSQVWEMLQAKGCYPTSAYGLYLLGNSPKFAPKDMGFCQEADFLILNDCWNDIDGKGKVDGVWSPRLSWDSRNGLSLNSFYLAEDDTRLTFRKLPLAGKVVVGVKNSIV